MIAEGRSEDKVSELRKGEVMGVALVKWTRISIEIEIIRRRVSEEKGGA